jgi:dihydrofolate synthase/folylpolyglutamate synthase
LLPQNIGAAVEALSRLPNFSLSPALLNSLSSMSVQGRLSRHRFEDRDVLLDVAHNTESVGELSRFLSDHPVAGKTRALFGVMGDKPIHDMLQRCADVIDEWNLIDLSHVPRAMAPEDVASILLAEQVADTGAFADLWRLVRARTQEHDRIVVFGSFFSVGEALAMMGAGIKNEDQR